MRLANYRLICANGLMVSHGKACHRCLGGQDIHAILQSCCGGRGKSTVYALRNTFARTTGFYRKAVTRYYAQTDFQKQMHVRQGITSDRIDVIANMADAAPEQQRAHRGRFVGFAGRLSREKGFDQFLDAARQLPNIPFAIAGDATTLDPGVSVPQNVTLMGYLGQSALEKFYNAAAMIVVPSMWNEGFPNVILDAMRHAKPVIANAIGGLSEIVDHNKTGILVPPGDTVRLAQEIENLWKQPERQMDLGYEGSELLRVSYSKENYYKNLMKTYESALSPRLI